MTECSAPTTCHRLHVTSHASHVTCHVSRVTCHMSRVTSHMSHFFFFFFFFFFGQSGEAYRWRVCYQRGLPRLVSAMIAMIRQFKYCVCITPRHGYKLYAPCSMLCCCMCTCFVPNVILSIMDKFCQHCPEYHVLVG